MPPPRQRAAEPFAWAGGFASFATCALPVCARCRNPLREPTCRVCAGEQEPEDPSRGPTPPPLRPVRSSTPMSPMQKLSLTNSVDRWACSPAVAALLAAGARVDAADVRGWTPVHAAAYAGHSGALRLLLEEARESKRAVQSTHAFTLDVRFTCCDVAAALTSPFMCSHGRVMAMSTGAPNSAAPCCQGRTPRRRGSTARLWREHCRSGRRWHDCRGPGCRLGVEPRAGVESLCSAPSAR